MSHSHKPNHRRSSMTLSDLLGTSASSPAPAPAPTTAPAKATHAPPVSAANPAPVSKGLGGKTPTADYDLAAAQRNGLSAGAPAQAPNQPTARPTQAANLTQSTTSATSTGPNAQPKQVSTLDPRTQGLLAQIQTLLRTCAASDFLVKEGQPLWYRADGTLQPSPFAPVQAQDIKALVSPVLASGGEDGEPVHWLQDKGDCDFALDFGPGARFRANLFWSENQHLAMALRVLPERIPEMSSLGLPPMFASLLGQTKGLLLVTGATGSGKTTTLASGINHLNQTMQGHIITMEDPVEYRIESRRCLVNQRQVGRDAKTFAAGLRSALRQDPDVLLIGELRDHETVKTALDAANTGHLVLGTLHTNSALQTIERVTSFFSEEQKGWAQAVLAQTLIGVISQVLVPRVSGGRILCAELLVNTPDVRQLIREGRTHQIFNSMDTGASKGHVLLNRVLRERVKEGVISAEDALSATYDPSGLVKELTAAGLAHILGPSVEAGTSKDKGAGR